MRILSPMLYGLVLVSASIATYDAHGASTEERSAQGTIEEIVVTARRKEESLQEVPVAVTSVGRDTLEAYEVTNLDKLQARIPSLNIQQGGAGGGASLSLRGVGTNNLSPAFESAVALDFDGLQVGQLRIVQSGFFDMGQVDVLKGPQSLFFGKSASAGVISFSSLDPSDVFEAGISAGYELEEEGPYVEGFISGPLTDTLSGRLALRHAKTDELIINDAPGVANPERGSEHLFARATLEWQPSDQAQLNLKLNYIKSERDGANMFADIDCGNNGVADPIVLLGGGLQIPAGYDCAVGDQRYFYADVAPPLVASLPRPYRATTTPYHDSDVYLARLKFDLELSDQVALTSLTGYYGLRTEELEAFSYGGYLGPVPFGTGLGTPNIETDQYSQELRLAGSDIAGIDWLVGLYYEERDAVYDAPLYAVNIGIVGADPITGFTTDLLKLQDTKSETFSAFVSFIRQINDRLEIAGGVRYTDESKTSNIRTPFQHLFLAGSGGFLPTGFETGPIEFDDDSYAPEISLRYALSEEVNVYAAYKTGFKAGGIDSSVLPTASLAVSKATGDFSDIIFESEESEGFEIGLKSDWLDRALRLNAVAYRYVFDNLQIQQFDPVAIQFITLNASEITSTGIDIDLVWQPPINGLTITASLGLLDAEYSDDFFPNGPANDNLKGRTSRYAPDFSGNIALDWVTDLGGWTLFVGGNVSYTDSYFIADGQRNDPKQSGFATVDVYAGLSAPNDHWQVRVSAVNLDDKAYKTSNTGRPFLAPGVGDDRIVSFNRGRQIYLEISARL